MTRLLFILSDLVLVSAGELLAFFMRLGCPLPQQYWTEYRTNWILIALIRIWALFSVKAYADRFKSFFLISNAIFKSVVLSSVIITGLTYFNRNLGYPRSVILFAFASTLILLLVKYYFYWKYYIIRKHKKRVVIIGSNQTGRNIIRNTFSVRHWEVVGFIDDRQRTGMKVAGGLTVLGKLKDLKSLVHRKKIDLAVVAMPSENIENKLKVFMLCEELNLDYIIIPSFYEIVTGRAKLDEIDDMAVIEPAAPSIGLFNRIIKRGFDIVFSFLLLLAASPLLLLIAVLIKSSSPGPVVYRQKRSGQIGRPFYVYKFRTMVADADRIGPLITEKNDSRVTWIGRFLRRYSLDEILQFYNVLKGDMSVIGPRPEVVEIVKEYKEWQRKVLKVKPGLSGLAQISGRQELDIDTKLKLDLFYINNYSILLDLEIIVKTVFVVLKGRGAF